MARWWVSPVVGCINESFDSECLRPKGRARLHLTDAPDNTCVVVVVLFCFCVAFCEPSKLWLSHHRGLKHQRKRMYAKSIENRSQNDHKIIDNSCQKTFRSTLWKHVIFLLFFNGFRAPQRTPQKQTQTLKHVLSSRRNARNHKNKFATCFGTKSVFGHHFFVFWALTWSPKGPPSNLAHR